MIKICSKCKQDIRNKILGQNIQGVTMDAENKRENHING